MMFTRSLWPLMLIISGMLSTHVFGHGFILYDVQLDFDVEMEEGIVKAAQNYLGIQEKPLSFDYENELINVQFDRDLELSVAVNPIDFSVVGSRNDSLVRRGGKVAFDTDQRQKVAEKVLFGLDEDYRSQLVYGGEKKLYQGTYLVTWFRVVDGVAALQERLEVEVDPVNGKVVYWRANHFFFSEDEITLEPAYSWEVAQELGNLYMSGETTEVKPVLTFIKDYAVWLVKVKQLYPLYVGLDARTGKAIFTGSLKGELPKDYDFGREVLIKQTSLVREIFGE